MFALDLNTDLIFIGSIKCAMTLYEPFTVTFVEPGGVGRVVTSQDVRSERRFFTLPTDRAHVLTASLLTSTSCTRVGMLSTLVCLRTSDCQCVTESHALIDG